MGVRVCVCVCVCVGVRVCVCVLTNVSITRGIRAPKWEHAWWWWHAAMLPDLGRLSLCGAPKMTSAPLSTATDPRTRESTSGAPESPKPKPRPKKQKVDPNEPSAEEKQAAYAARNAKAEHDARIEAAGEALEKARKTHFEVVGELLSSGGTDDELNARVEEAEAKVNALAAALKALQEAPAPAAVEPELMPGQTEAQKRIQELQKKRDRSEEEDAELEQLRGAGKKQLTDRVKAKKEAQALARAENKMANRQEAIDYPSRAEKLFRSNQGEQLWWKTIGRHLSSQKAKYIEDDLVATLAVKMGRGPPPAPPRAHRRIAWPLGAANVDDVLKQLNVQLESLGLAAVEAQRQAHAAEEARLGPVREQYKLNIEAAKREAKDAKAQAATDARERKARASAEAAQAVAESRAGAIAQGAKDAKARSAALARQDAEAQAALPWGKRRT